VMAECVVLPQSFQTGNSLMNFRDHRLTHVQSRLTLPVEFILIKILSKGQANYLFLRLKIYELLPGIELN
jgi:hypothetical protein